MIQDITTGLMEDTYSMPDGITRGQKLEELLTTVCNTLGEIGSLTEGKADVGFLLNIQGTYLIGKKAGALNLDDEGFRHPNELFDENLFPMLDTFELIEEPIEEEEDGSTTDTTISDN